MVSHLPEEFGQVTKVNNRSVWLSSMEALIYGYILMSPWHFYPGIRLPGSVIYILVTVRFLHTQPGKVSYEINLVHACI